MTADSKHANFCTYFSAILLGGLLLNALFGLVVGRSVAGLVMVPIIGKEDVFSQNWFFSSMYDRQIGE